MVSIMTSVIIMLNNSVNMSNYEDDIGDRRTEVNCNYNNNEGMWMMWGLNLLIIFGLYVKKWMGKSRKEKSKPRNWPIVGCQMEASLNFYRLHDWCHSFFSDDNRTVELKFFSTRVYLTVDPANVEHILRTNFRNYPKGERTIQKLKDLLGDGIFNADGETWKKQRKIANAVFNIGNKSLKELSLLSFRKDSLCLLATLLPAATSGRAVNLQDLLMSMTMDSISRVGFGIQEAGMYTMRSTFTNAFDKANAMISSRFVNVWWKLHKILKWGTEKALIQELANLNAFTSQVIADRRAELARLSSNTLDSKTTPRKAKDDILSKLMDMGGEASSEKDLRDSIMNFMIAGRDTTAVTMSWFIYNMCTNQEVANKIYQEVRDIVQYCKVPDFEANPLDTFQEVANCLTFEALSHMHYLHAALTETLRLYPAVPRDTKVAIHDDVLPDGTCIKKGDHVAYVPYSMGKMEFLWGADALEFKPERWLKDGQFKQPSPFKFTSFQAGPRMCIGKDWAYLQMKMAMALLMYFYKFKLVPNHAIRYQMMMVLAIANGLQVTVHRRTTH